MEGLPLGARWAARVALAADCPDLLPLAEWAAEAGAAAEAEGAAFAAIRGQGFKEWMRNSMAAGAGASTPIGEDRDRWRDALREYLTKDDDD